MAAQFVLNTGVLDTDVLGPIVFATFISQLDDLDAIAYGTVGNPTSATATLGGLVASATSLTGGSTSGLSFIQPNKFIPEPARKIVKVYATSSSKLGQLQASGVTRIDFSILNEDDEVLLLL
jgi:hypothetical protein